MHLDICWILFYYMNCHVWHSNYYHELSMNLLWILSIKLLANVAVCSFIISWLLCLAAASAFFFKTSWCALQVKCLRALDCFWNLCSVPQIVHVNVPGLFLVRINTVDFDRSTANVPSRNFDTDIVVKTFLGGWSVASISSNAPLRSETSLSKTLFMPTAYRCASTIHLDNLQFMLTQMYYY